jgi:hypothetical protein
VGRPGVIAGLSPQAHDGVLRDLDQAAGLADAAAVTAVLQHGESLIGGQVAVEAGGALAFGETLQAAFTVEQAARPAGPVEAARGDVASGALALLGTVRVEAAEAREVVHEQQPPAGISEVDDLPRCYLPYPCPVNTCRAPPSSPGRS